MDSDTPARTQDASEEPHLRPEALIASTGRADALREMLAAHDDTVGRSEARVWRRDLEESGSLALLGDLVLLPAEVITELMAALDALHRAHGGGGLRILHAHTWGKGADV